MTTVEIDLVQLHALSGALSDAADRVAVIRGRVIDALASIGREARPGVHGLRRIEATLRERSEDVARRVAEAARSQERALWQQRTLDAIRHDFAEHHFVPDAGFEQLSFEDKVSYYFVSQMGAVGWAVPEKWPAWSLKERLAYFEEHAQDIHCAGAREPFICEHEVGLLQIFVATATIAGFVADAGALGGLGVVAEEPLGLFTRARLTAVTKEALSWSDEVANSIPPPPDPKQTPVLRDARTATPE